ncbi:MAG: MFS transporter [Oscillospiraceae bacterium]|nr:MFS transporter [Oscillospiraceae bacterium]
MKSPLKKNNNNKTDEQLSSSAAPVIGSDRLWTKDFICIWIINLSISTWAFMIHAPFPLYIVYLGGNEMLVGITAGAVSLAALVIRPFAGWFLDNISRSFLFFAGTIVIIIASLLLYFVPILALVIALRILLGFLLSATTTTSITSAADAIPAERFGEGIGYLGLGNTLGTALGPALGLIIIARLGFPQLFITSAMVILFALLVSKGFAFKKIGTKERKKIKLASLFNKDAIPASLVMLLSSLPFGGVIVFIALYGEYYEIGNAAWYFVLIAVGSGTARLLIGRLVDRVGEQPMVIFGNGCFVVGLVLLLFHSSVCYYLSGLFFGFGFGVMNPAMQAMAMRIVPMEKRGSATSTFQCSFDLSGGLGGLIAGWIVTVWGYRPMFGAMIIFVAFSGLAYALWAAKTPSAFKVYRKNARLGA